MNSLRLCALHIRILSAAVRPLESAATAALIVSYHYPGGSGVSRSYDPAAASLAGGRRQLSKLLADRIHSVQVSGNEAV